MKKVILLVFVFSAALFAQTQDSVDVRAIIQKQIDAARERDRVEKAKADSLERVKNLFGPQEPAVIEEPVVFGPMPEIFGPEEPKADVNVLANANIINAKPEKANTIQNIVSAPVSTAAEKQKSSLIEYWKYYFLASFAAAALGFVFIRRKILSRPDKKEKQIKNNIRIIREEGLVKREQPELKSVRSKLLNSPVILNNHGKPLAEVAKELNIAQGEIILAAKIKSYELAKDDKSKWYLN